MGARLFERARQLGLVVHARDAALTPAARRLDDEREPAGARERQRLVDALAARELRYGEARGAIAGAHRVLVLAAANGLGIGVKRQAEARPRSAPSP